MNFLNPKNTTGPKCDMLFAVGSRKDVFKIKRKGVFEYLHLKSFFEDYDCSEAHVQVVFGEDIIYSCCGLSFQKYHFFGKGFRGKDFMYAMSRFRPGMEKTQESLAYTENFQRKHMPYLLNQK